MKTVEDIVRDWFKAHGSECAYTDISELAASVDEDINHLSNAELLSHISMAIEERISAKA